MPSVAGPVGMPKEEFLRSVRQALGKGHPTSGGLESPYLRLGEKLADLEAQAQEIQRRNTANRTELLERLAATAQLLGWRVCRSPNPEEAIGYVISVATTLGAQRVVRSDQAVFNTVPLDTALKIQGVGVTTIARDSARSRESLRAEIVAADLGVTGADYAVAETGSVVVVPRKGLSRLVSVVPPVHIAVVRPQEVVDTLDDVFLLRCLEYHRNGGDMGSYLNFISGPSRTADIEQTLVVGVHGPKEVHLVLLG